MIGRLVTNPRLLILLTVLLLALGWRAFQALPKLEDPRIPNRVAVVTTAYPGAGAERVEALVTEKIEHALQQLPELKKLTSESRDGLSVVILELADAVYEPENETVWTRARDRLAQVQEELPAGVQPSRLDDRLGHAFTLVVGLRTLARDEAALAHLGRYARELENRLWRVQGTDYIEIVGRPREQIHITVDSARAAALGLDFASISRLVGGSDAKLATARLNGPLIASTVELAGELDSEARIGMIPLATLPDGRQLRLGDVASVQRAIEDPPEDIALVHGQRGVVLAARMGKRGQIAGWTRAVETEIAAMQQQLPANVRLEVLFSQAEYTDRRMQDLAANLWSGLALVVLILPFTMGWRGALIVAAALPLMLGFTLLCMRASGMGLNQMSIAGIIVALGIMVDNAIVVAHQVVAERRAGKGLVDAVGDAVAHLWMPLLGSTLTTIIGFMPAVLMEGPASEFPGAVARAVVYSLVGSLLIALGVVAAVTARWTPAPAEGAPWYEHGVRSARLLAAFRASLLGALARPRRAIAMILVLPLAGLLAAGLVEQRFFPVADRDMINIEIYLPESASLEATRAAVARIDAPLRALPELRSLHWFIGRSAPPYWYNLLRRHDGMKNYAQSMLRLSSADAARALVPRLQRELAALLPQAVVIVEPLVQGPPFNAPVEVRLRGPDLDVLHAHGEALRVLAAGIPGVALSRSTLGEAVPRAVVDIPEELLRRSGLSLAEASRQLQAALEGVEQGSVTEASEDVPVIVRVARDARRGLGDLRAMQFVLGKPDAQHPYPGTALDALGTVRLEPGRGSIPRRGATRENGIEVHLLDGVLSSTVARDLRRAMRDSGFALPPGYVLEFGGEEQEQAIASELMTRHVPELLVLLAATVILAFNSFRLGGFILAIGGISLALGLLVLALLGIPYGFVIVFAQMALMGLAINAAIVVLAEIKADPACLDGNPRAIAEAVCRCGRHVVGTTGTTVLGLLPLVYSANEFFSDMAAPIAGGTLLTTILSLYLVPVVFMLLARRGGFERHGDAAANAGFR